MNKIKIRKMQTASGGPLYPWINPAVQEWTSKENVNWRLTPAAGSKVVGGATKTIPLKRKPESSKEYTKRRIKEETKRTWRSDVADILHGIGEAALSIHPYTAVPYFGAKVGLDFLNGTYGWHTALNASVPLFHLSPQAVGLREATNVALEDIANVGSKTARNWRVAREINLVTKNNKPNIEVLNPTEYQSFKTTKLSEPSISLKFFERKPSKISFAERTGVPKGERNLSNIISKFGKPFTYDENGLFIPNSNYNFRNGWGLIEDAIKTRKIRVPEGDYKPAVLKKYPFLNRSIGPFSTIRDLSFKFPYFLRGESIWPFKTQVLAEDLIAIPNDLPGVSWNKVSKFNTIFEDEIASIGDKTTPIINGKLNIFPSDKALFFRLNKATNKYEPYEIMPISEGWGIYSNKYNKGFSTSYFKYPNYIDEPINIKKKKQGGKMNILEFLKNGSGIHIKKKNRGKFTASAKAAGLSVQEHARSVLNDPNATPLLKKRANFARNAAKWKHKKGGKAFVEGVNILDSNPKAYKYVKKKRYLNGGELLDLGLASLGNLIKTSRENKYLKNLINLNNSKQKAFESQSLWRARLKAAEDVLKEAQKQQDLFNQGLTFEQNSPIVNSWKQYLIANLYSQQEINNNKLETELLNQQLLMQQNNTANAISNAALGLSQWGINYLKNKKTEHQF